MSQKYHVSQARREKTMDSLLMPRVSRVLVTPMSNSKGISRHFDQNKLGWLSALQLVDYGYLFSLQKIRKTKSVEPNQSGSIRGVSKEDNGYSTLQRPRSCNAAHLYIKHKTWPSPHLCGSSSSMYLSLPLSFFTTLLAATSVAAHGYLYQITIDGTLYQGNEIGVTPNPSVIRQINTNSPIQPTSNPYLNCGQDAQLATLVANANPGSSVSFKWVGGYTTGDNVCLFVKLRGSHVWLLSPMPHADRIY